MKMEQRDTSPEQGGQHGRIAKAWGWVKDLPAEAWWRVLSIGLSIFVITPLFATMMFVFYMAEHGFFSYDFISQGVFGMKLFIVTALLSAAITAAGLYGLPFLGFAAFKKKPVGWPLWLAFSGLGLIAWFIVFMAVYNGRDVPRVIFMCGITAAMAVHAAITTMCQAKYGFFSLLAVAVLAIYLPASCSSQAAQWVGLGLASYGAGGLSPITVHAKDSKDVVHGKLLLQSPNTLYLVTESSGDAPVTFPIANANAFCVGRKGKAPDRCI
ncbi:hypothetical protein [Hydrocarboniphaga sp.]|uniref:hypothetical protein n=1 Tax=Hydrocarboniphaga sp. TaxID=2033016 RepID=UPI002AB973B9|nr:hypothetical protein [Hydrocarboniphaga sp.]MDZ4078099.1 hypothetical protein [Hydrocarboniphaga sp.]